MRGANICEQSSSNIISYNLLYESNILSGIGVTNGHLSLSELLSKIEFSYIKFIHEEIFFFQKKIPEGDQPFEYNEQLTDSEKGNVLKQMVSKSKEIRKTKKNRMKDSLKREMKKYG